MEQKVLFADFERPTLADYDSLGQFPRDSFDHLIADTIIPGKGFTGFACSNPTANSVLVAPGRLYENGKVFYNDDGGGTVIDMLPFLPAASKRIVAIVVSGAEIETETVPRTFMTDVSTRATVARQTSTVSRRRATPGVAAGNEGPSPIAPTGLADNLYPVAYVTLGTTGVLSIAAATANKAPNLAGAIARLNENDAYRLQIGSDINTLGSNISALAAGIQGTASFGFVQRIAADVARLRELSKLPAAYSSYGSDHFLDISQSAIAPTEATHVDWYAKVEEGIRFPDAAIENDPVALLNPNDPKVIVNGSLALPAYTNVTRLSNLYTDSAVAISSYSVTTQTMVQKTMTRTRTRYGTPFLVCSNSTWWASVGVDYMNATVFNVGSETFQVLGSTTDYADGTNIHQWVRVQQIFTDQVSEPYWDQQTTTQTASGAMVGESFLNTQDGWLTNINLMFAQVGATGDVRVILCEATASGSPDLTSVIAQQVVPVASLVAGGALTRVGIVPTFLMKGRRYALVLLTVGNHFIYTSDNGRYGQGTFFTGTDGAWFQGDLLKDMAFSLDFASFAGSRYEVQLNAIQLGGGIAAIDVISAGYVPDGTQLSYEVYIGGAWVNVGTIDPSGELDTLDPNATPVLAGLPPLLQFRAVFVGTPDIMPSLGLGAVTSRVKTFRPAPTMKHISTVRTLPAASSTITVIERLEAWDAGYHTQATRLRTGAGYTTIVNATTITTKVSDSNPNAVQRTSIFNLGAAVTSYRIQTEGTTTNVLKLFHVAERIDIAN